MRITLVDNVLLEQTAAGFELEFQPHLGLISLIAVLREAGHDVLLYDPKLAFLHDGLALGGAYYANVAERILAADPQIVGFTSLGCNFACTARIAEAMRAARPDIAIVVGGPHATIVDRQIIERYPQFDAIVRNEAEGTIAAVIDALGGRTSLDAVPGVTIRRDGRAQRNPDGAFLADLDALPLAAYDAYPIAQLGLTVLDVDAGRGCPFTCTFCSSATYFGRRYRLKSAQRLLAELDALAARYAIRRFSLTHDLFTVDKRKVRAFCAAVAPRAFEWTCSARIDCVDDALLATMREAGCVGIYYGIETGSQRLQPIVGKKLNLSLYDPVISRSLQLGITATASFITGFPEESEADAHSTLDLIRASIRCYSDDLTLQLHLLTPEPGTGLHALHGETLGYDGHIGDFNFPALHPDDTALIANDSEVFVCHHYYRRGLPREQTIAMTEGWRGLYRLGHKLLDAMIDAYPGSFARMLADYADIARSYESDPYGALLAFTTQRWPAGDPFIDAVAFLQARSMLRPEPAARIVSAGERRPIRLSALAVPVDCEGDGAEFIRRLYAGEQLDAAAVTRGPYLLLAGATRTAHKMLPIDRATYDVAAQLRSATCADALAQLFDTSVVRPRLRALSLLGAIVDGDGAPDERTAGTIHAGWLPNRHVVERAAPVSALR